MLGILGVAHANLGDALLNLLAALGSARTRLVVVVDEIDVHTLTAIAAIAAPVVEDVVADINTLVGLCGLTRTQSRTARVVVSQQVMVVGGTAATPVATIAVGTLLMTTVAQTLADDAPLYSDILTAIYRTALVYAPRHRAVIDDDIIVVRSTQTITFVCFRVSLQRYIT